MSYVSRLFRKAHQAVRRSHTRVPRRHAHPYSTHVPILTGIAKLTKIRTVVELGSGEISTSLFLNRSLFPDLTSLTSLEDDPEWFDKIQRSVVDERLNLILVDGPMSRRISRELLTDCDLVLIDDSRCADQRSATIRRVANVVDDDTLVVIHDYEVDQYQEAAMLCGHRFHFDALMPATGLCRKNALPCRRELKRLNRVIRNMGYFNSAVAQANSFAVMPSQCVRQ